MALPCSSRLLLAQAGTHHKLLEAQGLGNLVGILGVPVFEFCRRSSLTVGRILCTIAHSSHGGQGRTQNSLLPDPPAKPPWLP